MSAVAPGDGYAATLVATLTAREREVLALLAEGCCNGELAERLVISAATARHHVEHILRKLGVTNRAAAAAILHRVRAEPSASDLNEA